MRIAFLEWLNPIFEVSEFCLQLAAYATFAAFPLAIIVLAINLAFRRWMSAWQINLLWGIVLLRLMIPFAPSSTMSVQNALVKLFADSPPASTEYWDTVPYPDGNDEAEAEAAEARRQAYVNEVLASNPATVESTDPLWAVVLEFMVDIAIPLSWPFVAAIGILWTIAANFRFSWKVNRMPFNRDERLAGLWLACCEKAKVQRTIPIVTMDDLQQPAMMGVFQHRLLLPQDAIQLSDDELRMIMLHELAHVRRRDIAINWAMVFVRALHWWNPVYWLAASRFAATREQACDAFVIRHTAGTSGRGYGELLLKLAEKIPGRSRWRVLVPTPILGFMLSALRRRSIAARLRVLPRAAVVRSRWHAVVVAVATVLLGYAGLTDAKTASDEAGQDESILDESESIFPGTFERADVLTQEKPVSEEPVISRDYEFERVLRKIAGSRHSLDEAKKTLEVTIRQFVLPKQDSECRFDGEKLVVVAKESFHRELEQNLLAWEKSGLAQICVECRFIALRQGHLARINIPWRYMAASAPTLQVAGEHGFRPHAGSDANMPRLPQGTDESTFRATVQYEESMPLIYSILNHKQAAYVVRGVQSGRPSGLLQAPKVTVFNGNRCFLSDVSQRPFVVGVNPIVGDFETALQPQIAVYDLGTKIYLRPVLSADHKRIQLNSRIEFSEVVDVKTASVFVPAPEGAGDPATIQVPKIRRMSVDINAELEQGHSLLLGSSIERLDAVRKVSNLFVLLTPILISDDSDAAK